MNDFSNSPLPCLSNEVAKSRIFDGPLPYFRGQNIVAIKDFFLYFSLMFLTFLTQLLLYFSNGQCCVNPKIGFKFLQGISEINRKI